MKIEICEQMVQSWLHHIKECQIVQTNWMISPLHDISSNITYVKWLMKDISEKLNKEIDAHTIAELSVIDVLDATEDSVECDNILEDRCEDSKHYLYQNLMQCFAVLNKKETAAIKNIFGKSTPKQFITQCEIDVAGIKLNTVDSNRNSPGVEKIYLIDSAFHKSTLGYGDAAARVLKKLIRACIVSEIVFGCEIPVEIAFATPQCSPGLSNKIHDLKDILCDILRKHYSPKYDNIQIELYFNNRFADEIYKPLRDNTDDLNNDNDLFMRSMNLAKVAEMNITKTTSTAAPKSKVASSGAPAKHAVSSDLTYEMAAHYLKNKDSMEKVGTKFLPTPDTHGSKTKSRLKRIGILGKHKGLLIGSNIDDEIAKAPDDLKITLEEIKKRGL